SKPVSEDCAKPRTYQYQHLIPQSSATNTGHSWCSSTLTKLPNPVAAVTHQTQDQSRTTHGHHHQKRPHTYNGHHSLIPEAVAQHHDSKSQALYESSTC